MAKAGEVEMARTVAMMKVRVRMWEFLLEVSPEGGGGLAREVDGVKVARVGGLKK